jgi:hypothetical protein
VNLIFDLVPIVERDRVQFQARLLRLSLRLFLACHAGLYRKERPVPEGTGPRLRGSLGANAGLLQQRIEDVLAEVADERIPIDLDHVSAADALGDPREHVLHGHFRRSPTTDEVLARVEVPVVNADPPLRPLDFPDSGHAPNKAYPESLVKWLRASRPQIPHESVPESCEDGLWHKREPYQGDEEYVQRSFLEILDGLGFRASDLHCVQPCNQESEQVDDDKNRNHGVTLEAYFAWDSASTSVSNVSNLSAYGSGTPSRVSCAHDAYSFPPYLAIFAGARFCTIPT